MSSGLNILWCYQNLALKLLFPVTLFVLSFASKPLSAEEKIYSDFIDMSLLLPAEDEERAPKFARGVIKARNQAVLTSGIGAKITDLPILAGMSFQQNQTLVKFNCDKPLADVRAATQNVEIQKQKVIVNNELASFESISNYEVLVAKAELQKSIAERDSLVSALTNCEIIAPYDGQVVETFVNRYETVGPNEPLLSIVDVSHLEVSIIVPSIWLRWLKVNSAFIFSVDEVDKQLSGKVTRISPIIDPVSRTIKIIGDFSIKDIQDAEVLPGMSGRADFEY